MKIAEKIFNLLASLKLAVLIILALLIISAWGTIVESRYDLLTAQRTVYHSPYMYFVLFMLAVNLIAVMMDRLPWKKHHTGFILAHIGIITVLVGSYITRKAGIDGTISFEIGETTRYVSLMDNDLVVYKLKDVEESEKIFSQDVDFFRNDPKKKPISIQVGNEEIKFTDFKRYARREFQVNPGDKITDGPAMQFNLKNNFVNLTEWVVQSGSQPASLNLGPLEVVLASNPYESLGGNNKFVIQSQGKKTNYSILSKDNKVLQKGSIKLGDVIETPWMGMKFQVLQYLPKARVNFEYHKLDRPNANSTSAVLVEFRDQKHWLGLNTFIQLFTEDTVYFVTYGNKRIELGFPMTLLNFEMEKYQGTEMAKSYKSLVDVPNLGATTISMNEPLKHNGYTFYQSSFQEDKMGNPIASILTVNYDPGRFLKYLGSFLIVLGSVMLFYFKKFGKHSELKKRVVV